LAICRNTTRFVILSERSESKDLPIIVAAVHFSGAKIPPLRYASVGMTGAAENLTLLDKLEFIARLSLPGDTKGVTKRRG